tara:strand:+ start:339 stop:620 length:282 start_codon:yes stop_codon:yes gene_type:complete
MGATEPIAPEHLVVIPPHGYAPAPELPAGMLLEVATELPEIHRTLIADLYRNGALVTAEPNRRALPVILAALFVLVAFSLVLLLESAGVVDVL